MRASPALRRTSQGAARRLTPWLAIAAGVALAGPAPAAPRRVMSINLCTDQLALALLPPERIASVTWLSRDPATSRMAAQARRVGVNHGQAEEVVRDRPDLVLAGAYAAGATTALLKRLGYRVLVLQPEEGFADIRRDVRLVAQAVGEPARGEALLARMDATLADLARDRAPPLRVAAWDGAGFAAGPHSLYDAILTAAGARNVAGEAGAHAAGTPEVEALLAAAPQLLVAGEPAFEAPDRRSDVAHHPLVRRYWGDRTLIVPQPAYLCGTPFSADAAVSLRDQMRAKLSQARTPLPFAASVGR